MNNSAVIAVQQAARAWRGVVAVLSML